MQYTTTRWGGYFTISKDDRNVYNKLILKPLAGFSIQRHSFRREHWRCEAGIGAVALGYERSGQVKLDSVLKIRPYDFVEIDYLQVHCLYNPHPQNLLVIDETWTMKLHFQSGESDIHRYADPFNHAQVESEAVSSEKYAAWKEALEAISID